MIQNELKKMIETEEASAAYKNYLEVRDRVLSMLAEMKGPNSRPSDYWEEELAGFDYMLDASPLIIRKLREHCHHITGLRSYEYRSHHRHQLKTFARKLDMLRKQDKNNLLVPESELLGGFGHCIDGALYNIDTLKFYECLIAMDQAGLLTDFRAIAVKRKTVMEIGAGWGGFAYQFKTLFPNATYILIDLPQTLLFSAVYLKTLFPSASVLMYGDKPNEILLKDLDKYDFVFLPHYFINDLQLERLDLVVNMASFQEMTTDQVEGYVKKTAEMGCPHLYSMNRDRSPNNDMLTSVSSVMKKYYGVEKFKVLDIPYREMFDPVSRLRQAVKNLIKVALKRVVPSIYDDHHLIGTLNK